MSGGAPAIRHHPSEATLAAYAAGTLWKAAGPVVQGHLDLCPRCRAVFDVAEAVGGAFLDELPPTALSPDALRRVAERLGAETGVPAQQPPPQASAIVGGVAAVAPHSRWIQVVVATPWSGGLRWRVGGALNGPRGGSCGRPAAPGSRDASSGGGSGRRSRRA